MTGMGERFKDARKKAGLQQEQVSQICGVRRATVSDLERGFTKNMRPELLEKLCTAVGVDVDYIINGWRCADGLGIDDADHMSKLGQLDRIEYKLDLLLARTKHLRSPH